MKCPHCLVEFHAEIEWDYLGEDVEGYWALERYECPNTNCRKLIFFLVVGEPIYSQYANGGKSFSHIKPIHKRILVHPKGSNRPPVPPEVPKVFADDYIESCLVLPDSPKASAALSRRCLQNLLREHVKVKPGKLADEIQQVIDSGMLPAHLVDAIDAVRNVGNFAAHPLKSEKSGEILSVEPAEAEWNLDVIESLFDFYFVQPALIKKKRAALDEKLKESGQKPMK